MERLLIQHQTSQNVFVHFEPLGHTLQYEEDENEESLKSLYQQAWNKLQSKCSDDEDCKQRVDLNLKNKVPHYIIPGSEEERRWLQTHPKARVVSVFAITHSLCHNINHSH